MNVMLTPAYHENLLALLMDADSVTLGNGITWTKTSNMEREFSLRAIVPMELIEREDDIRMYVWRLMTDTLETMLSETTNNDACRITISETSAHYHDHDIPDMPFASAVVYDGRIDDYLS